MATLKKITDTLVSDLANLTFAEPVASVYNPLVYARKPHDLYLKKFGKGPKKAIFLGMNPGPWGMAQTGVPFGEVAHVRDWLGIEAKVGKPEGEHPKRPVTGFACERSEVSGRRLWGWCKERFGTADAFFEDFYIANYCPLIFLEDTGRNRVPEKLPISEREPMIAACDKALAETVKTLKPEWVIGVGKWAEKRAKVALSEFDVQFGSILHPSPASPAANRGWAPQAEAQLQAMGIALP